MKLCILFIAAIMGSAAAETLNQWLGKQVQRDEQLLVDTLEQTGGHSLDLLKHAKTYVPFFPEAPEGIVFGSPEQKEEFETWMKDSDQDVLSGGYVYRIKFKVAPPLYAMSAGEWDGNDWHSLTLGKDVRIETSNLWESTDANYLYTTLLSGSRPQLVSYDHRGEVAKKVAFDISDSYFEQQLQAAIAPYSSSEKPVFEMISLAEYLQNPNAIWRTLDISGQFNLRNQHKRPDEQERLKQIGHLTRSAVVGALMTDTATTYQPKPTLRPPPFVRPPPKQSAETKLSPIRSENPASSTPWSVIVILIAATIGLAWLLLKKRK